MVGFVVEMFLGHSPDGGRIENSSGLDQRGVRQVLSPGFEVLLEPSGDGHGKSGLFSLEDGGREVVS